MVIDAQMTVILMLAATGAYLTVLLLFGDDGAKPLGG